MRIDKNNISLYSEEQIVQQKIKIPTNFVELKTIGKNYICSTQGWPKRPVCERYGFSANGKWVQLDIPQEIMKKLELELGKEIVYPIYISPKVLKQKPDEFGGITVNNEKDIIYQKEGIILIQEKETQVDFTSGEITDLKQKLQKSEELSQETQTLLEKVLKDNEEKHIAIIFFEEEIKNLVQRITELRRDLEQEILNRKREESKNQELERIIGKLRKDEQVLIGLQTRISNIQTELGNQITTLTEERDGIQGDLDNLRNEYRRIRWKFLSSWFRKTEKSKKITDLKIKIAGLNSKLFDKNQQITDLRNAITARNQTITDLNNQINQLTTKKNDLQTQKNNLEGTVREKDRTITNLRTNLTNESDAKTRVQNEVSRLNSEVDNLKNQLKSAQNDYHYYRNQYRLVNSRLQELGDLSEVQEVDIFHKVEFKIRGLEIHYFEAQLSDKLSSDSSKAKIDMSGIKSTDAYANHDGYVFGALHYKKRKVRIVSPNSYSFYDDNSRIIHWDQRTKTIADHKSWKEK